MWQDMRNVSYLQIKILKCGLVYVHFIKEVNVFSLT